MLGGLKHFDVLSAAKRIQGKVYRTPTFESHILNGLLGKGHRVFFKCENLQRTGAFKARGALNSVLRALEQRKDTGAAMPRVVTYSSGNHAQATSWACAQEKVPCTVFMPSNVSAVKAAATRAYGAEVVLTETRQEAEALAAKALEDGAMLIPPFDHDDVIAGQGTATLEALTDLEAQGAHADAVFVPVGGGGLLSGTFLATQGFARPPLVIGAEPLAGNDAIRSLQEGRVVKLEQQPNTLADGAMTLSVSERTLAYLKQAHAVMDVDEDEMRFWTQWATHLTKMTVEPTSMMTLAASVRWLREQNEPKTVVLIVSGGNMDFAKRQAVWDRDRMGELPRLDIDVRTK